MKLGFLSSQNYYDKNAWSGTLYHMHQALMSTDLQIINLGYPRISCPLQRFFKRKTVKDHTKIGSQHYLPDYFKFAQGVEKQLKKAPCDVILSTIKDVELNLIRTNIPIVKLSDTTFNLIESSYCLENKTEDIEWIYGQEHLSLVKAKKLLYSSAWAANSAIYDYGVESEKIEIIPFGANIDTSPLIDEILPKKLNLPYRLLFIGKDWQQKGGETAFQTLVSLCQRGVDAELTVVGYVPPEIKHEKLTIIPCLNENYPQPQLDELFLKSHFLLSPSRTEYSGATLCQANAFGLPVIASEVGGIPTIIKNGRNGYMLPSSASGEDYADLIIENLSNPICYENLVRSSKAEYEKRLNWQRWAESFHQLITSMVK